MALDPAGVGGDIDRAAGAERARHRQRRGDDIGGDDLGRAVQARRGHHQRTDRPAAGHEQPLAQQRPGARDRMQRDRERLGQRRELDRHAGGDLDALAGSTHQGVAKRPLHMR